MRRFAPTLLTGLCTIVTLASCETTNGTGPEGGGAPAGTAAAPDPEGIDPACLEDPRRRSQLPGKEDSDFERADSAFHIGLELAKSGDHRAAQEAFERALKADPRHALAHLALADAHLYTDNDHDAMYRHLAAAVLLLPTNPRAHMQYASLSADAGADDVAIRHWQCALALKPNLPDARYALARQYLEKGKPELAEGELRSALRHDDANVQYQVLLGEVLEAKGDPLDAARAVEKAATLVEGSAALYRRAGALYDAAGDATAADRVRRVADEIDPPKKERDLRPLRKARKKRSRRKR